MAAILHALSHVHRKGIVHNDIKPANILIPSLGNERNGAVAKLTDFGVARVPESYLVAPETVNPRSAAVPGWASGWTG